MSVRPWIVDDGLWALIESLLPPWPEKAPGPTKGGEATGPSPVDRGKTGSRHHLICDGKGAPVQGHHHCG